MDFVFDASLVLYLPLHKLDGASFMSGDMYGHLCSVFGATWVLGGRSFDGVDDFISIPDSPVLDITAGLTLETWVNVTKTGAYQEIVYKQAAGAGYNDPFLLRVENNDCLAARIGDGISAENYIGGGSAISGSGWRHVVFGYDASYLHLLVDTQPDAAPLAKTVTPVTNNSNMLVGKGYYGKVGGIIGEVRLYNRLLTSGEIQRNYLATKWRYR